MGIIGESCICELRIMAHELITRNNNKYNNSNKYFNGVLLFIISGTKEKQQQ